MSNPQDRWDDEERKRRREAAFIMAAMIAIGVFIVFLLVRALGG